MIEKSLTFLDIQFDMFVSEAFILKLFKNLIGHFFHIGRSSINSRNFYFKISSLQTSLVFLIHKKILKNSRKILKNSEISTIVANVHVDR